jgi:hypothetical protein
MPVEQLSRSELRVLGTHTVLTGWLDQSALHGALAEIEALGPVLLEVRQVKSHGGITEIQ